MNSINLISLQILSHMLLLRSNQYSADNRSLWASFFLIVKRSFFLGPLTQHAHGVVFSFCWLQYALCLLFIGLFIKVSWDNASTWQLKKSVAHVHSFMLCVVCI